MNPFEDLRTKMDAIRAGIGEILKESVREAAPVIEDEIIAQLKRGERGDGQSLPDYSPTSVFKYGKRPGPMTLEDTGDYHRGHTVIVDDDGFEIRNTDWKTPKLAMTYGREILDLQSQSFDVIKNDFLTDAIMFNINRFLVHGNV
jgi:hypothetical protein